MTDVLRSDPPRSPSALSAADIELAVSYGIEIRPDSVTPLRRDKVWTRPLPFARRHGGPPPNIIVIFAESLSASLIDPYRADPIGLTPNMSAMAQRSMRVDDYYNHAFPTVRGLRGQICSAFSAFGHEAWRDAAAKLLSAKMRCLPHMLAEEGYRSVYLSPAARSEVYTESQFVDFGFDELYFRDTLVTTLLGSEPFEGDGMPGDRQVFRALVAYLERWDRSRPLFVALSTIQTHTGWDVTGSGVRWGDGGNRVLNTFHNLDHAFGAFWSWFQTSPYRDDTIVVLTGDHVIWPHDTARRAIGAGAQPREVDKLALIVYDPFHDLPSTFRASTSSVDLAPSLLHLAEVGNAPNAFAGMSMFADRTGSRGGPGQGEWTELLRWEDGRPIVEDVTPERCDSPDARDTHACSLLRIIEYLQSLEVDNRLWRD